MHKFYGARPLKFAIERYKSAFGGFGSSRGTDGTAAAVAALSGDCVPPGAQTREMQNQAAKAELAQALGYPSGVGRNVRQWLC
jgi:hypothetical protein